MNNIKLIFDDKEILVNLVDNVVTKKLIKELPIVLNFDDYSRIEKIAYIHKKYQIDSTSSPYCPAKGDLMFYAPWGYLALFYNDYIASKDYVMIGKVIAGMMHLDSLKGNVRLEKAV
ncbi:MAG: cyclophilin-like fold protein [Clostridia bacterium]|nr:cyclophilin-like fold protein [Clostridia bacterium]